jgi:hypothetical protein
VLAVYVMFLGLAYTEHYRYFRITIIILYPISYMGSTDR